MASARVSEAQLNWVILRAAPFEQGAVHPGGEAALRSNLANEGAGLGAVASTRVNLLRSGIGSSRLLDRL